MTRVPWIAQLYGYVVCIVALVAFLISVSGFVDAAFDRAHPLQARGGFVGGGSLTSFEAFRATVARRGPNRMENSDAADTLTTADLRARYEALRADHLAQVNYASSQRLVRNGLLILITVALFFFHWRWLRHQHVAVDV